MDPKSETEDSPDSGLMTHREIADLLGIGRARVFYLEHQALKKIADLMASSGAQSLHDFEELPFLHLPDSKQPQEPVEKFSPQHGWLKVDKIVSLNDGSEDQLDVVRTYRFLKASHEKLMRPPVVMSGKNRIERVIQAVAIDDASFFVRLWPKSKTEKRSVANLTHLQCNVIVESEFDSDSDGEFDVPIMVCVILSKGRGREGLMSKEVKE